MADATSDSGDIIDSIRTQLEGLKRTDDGMLLYRLIERGLGKRPDDTGGTDEAFLTFLYTLLERYAKNRDGDPITRIKVRVIQQRITPHLLHEDQESPEPESDDIGEAEPESGIIAELKPEAETIAADEQSPLPEPVVEPEVVGEAEPATSDSGLDSLELIPDLAAELEKEPEPGPVEPPKTKQVAEPEPEPIRPVKASDLVAEQPTPAPRKPAKTVTKNSRTKKSKADKQKKTTAEKKPVEKKPEPPKKPVKLELVDPTDLTKPPSRKESQKQPEPDEGYIDLGGEDSATVKKSVGSTGEKTKIKAEATTKAVPPVKEFVESAAAKAKSQAAIKKSLPTQPAAQGTVKKQELMPRKPVREKTKPKKLDTGEPSQERVEKLHEAFVHKMAESITRSQDYHRLLRSHMKAITLADNENDFRDLKTLLLRGMQDLLKGNEALGRDLDSTSHYLKIARLDRALLKDELGRIKDNTTIDELTALQNKEAFVKQLESEISRVNRYGFSFAIAVLDIDDLKKVNSTYGRDAGDEVIRCYARQILSQFRSYDLVARHREDEFLLLFPNTQKEGAIRAVEKAQKRAANLYINHKDNSIKVPTFTSVLTTYAPGDKPETLLKRTTEALVQAQKSGRDQVILALPTA